MANPITIATFPQRAINGPGSIAVNQDLDPAVRVVALTMQQIGWPYTGEDALQYQIDYSPDSGQSWNLLTSDVIPDLESGGPPTKWPAGTIHLAASVPSVGAANRRVRISWNAFNTYSVSGQVDVI